MKVNRGDIKVMKSKNFEQTVRYSELLNGVKIEDSFCGRMFHENRRSFEKNSFFIKESICFHE